MRGLTIAILFAGCGGDPGSGTDGGGGGDGGVDDALSDGMEGDGPIISMCPAGTWCVETAPATVTGLVHAIDAVNANDVFAVGDGGAIIRRQDGEWTQMTSGTTEDLRGVWAQSSTNVWAVGQNGTVLRWNGTDWAPVANAPDIDYTGVWGAGADDVWLIGTASAVHWTGSFATLAITGAPVSISGVAANDVWIASESGKVSRWTGGPFWTLCSTGQACAVTPNSFFAVGARAADDVWVALPGTGTLRWNGSSWTPHASDATLFASIHAPAANNAWGVGGTKVGHWNGSAWTISSPVNGFADSLYGVTGAGPHTWAVGQDAAILYHRD
ncbi:MAG: WD40/YVTN/BNR-like repeat-containing protein [Kofleriaceae bacterium]